ncbi:hypothetical protein [Marinagarivorans algicola]|uniref:hypothetical protein n=1 Tax=Marinagarivorans algicola TaxID=1513270 RepID=UPI0012E30917|nr:hypothetical protein [Marinagarivorans algicola]
MKKLTILLSLSLVGCTGDRASSHNNSVITWNMDQEDELMAYTKIQIKTYENEGYTEVTSGNTHSLVTSDTIRVWVNNAAAYDYLTLHQGMHFPVGTTIIRVIYGMDNQPKKITASVKAAANQNPDASDWIFAVADIDGVFMKDNKNHWQFGALEACNACHVNRLLTDGLFGLQH